MRAFASSRVSDMAVLGLSVGSVLLGFTERILINIITQIAFFHKGFLQKKRDVQQQKPQKSGCCQSNLKPRFSVQQSLSRIMKISNF